MERKRAVEKFFSVKEIKNVTSIIRQSINTTLPTDTILNLKFKLVPRFHVPSLFPHYCTHKIP